MIYRKLGKNGPDVSVLGLGCMGMSGLYGAPDEKSGSEVILEAFKQGINFFDTADMYGMGANEILLGQSVKPFRNQVFVATKCGIDATGDALKFNNTPEYIKKACHKSLKNLNVDVIDLYYLHRYNPEIPIEESMQAMLELIKEGKIKYVGLSEVDGEIVERAHRVLGDKLIALQSEYSIINRKAAEVALPTCRKLGIGFVPYSPIARGLLSGNIRKPKKFDKDEPFDFRSVHPQFQQETLSENLHLVDAVVNLEKRKIRTPAQLSLAWLLAQGDDIFPIPGTKQIKYLMENIGALDVNLDKNDLHDIAKVMKTNPTKGERFPKDIMNIAYLKF